MQRGERRNCGTRKRGKLRRTGWKFKEKWVVLDMVIPFMSYLIF